MSKIEKRKYRINLEGFVTPKNHNEFINLLGSATKGRYEIVSKFSMMNGYGRFLHKKCGAEFRTNPYKLLIEGEGCPDCRDKININHVLFDNKYEAFIMHSNFTKKMFNRHSDEFIALGLYEDEYRKIDIIHTKCGEVFKRRPVDILNGNILCPKCNPRTEWTLGKIKKEIKSITNGEFEVVGKTYKSFDTPIEIRHNVCGEVFEDSPNAFIDTPKCKVCEKDISLHEKIIRDYLAKHKIEHEREYSIDGCRNISLLKFDFAIFNDKEHNDLACVLEYDGEHHYYPVYGEESFVRVQITDRTKNRFCKDNKIKLIRIPFWEKEDLEEILKNKLKELKLIK